MVQERRIDLARLIVTLATRVQERKSTIAHAQTTLRATLDVCENVERNGVRPRVEEICPPDVLWLARELCGELIADQTGQFDAMLHDRRQLVNSMGVDFPLR